VVREEVGAGGRNDPSLYAHMNNKTIKKKNEYRIFRPVEITIRRGLR
jgi:hypothetical protein